RVDQVIRTEIGVFNNQFRRNGVDILTGRASFVDPHVLRIESLDGNTITCHSDHILIASGTRPAHTDSIPFDGVRVFDTDAMINLPAMPKLLTIVGGGVIGVEYACMAAALGVQV